MGGAFRHWWLLPARRKAAAGAESGYISIVVFELLLMLYVRMGVHKRGMRLREADAWSDIFGVIIFCELR